MHAFRHDIQIIRGISIVLVVLYHLGFRGTQNGFLGVDVFFVISGFLMATLYEPGSAKGFFIKRARRILPAYFVTIALTLIAAAILVGTSDLSQVVTQSIFASAMLSNIGFWTENSYFDKSAFKPLLHLWSLGVEIQFYAIVPLLYFIFRKFRLSLFVFLFISSIACFLVAGISPKTAFFWMPFRLWEFLIGFAVATYGSQRGQSSLGWIGLAALAAILGTQALPLNWERQDFFHGHPGIAALFVAAATGTTLWCGLPKNIETTTPFRIFEKLGTYSYSIYLVHFPIIVLTLYKPFMGTIIKPDRIYQLILIITIIYIAAWLLYKFIEHPFRANARLILWCPLSIMLILSLGQAGRFLQEKLLPPDELKIHQAWEDRSQYRCGKLFRLLHPTAISCEITPHKLNPAGRILLVGNSHADAIKTTFAEVSNSNDISVFFIVPNNPLMSGGLSPSDIINEAKNLNVDAVVLHFSPSSIATKTIEELEELAEKQNLSVSFIMPIPVWNKNVPSMLLEALHTSTLPDQKTKYDYENENKSLLEKTQEMQRNNIRIYQTVDKFCHDTCVLSSREGYPYYFDEGHLTLTGSRLLKPIFAMIINDIKSTGRK